MARRLGRPGTAGRSLLFGLALLLVGCSGGGDSGSLTPVNAPAGSSAALEEQATQNLVDLYCTAVLQEDSDRLQALLEGEGGAFAGISFRDFMAGTFRQFAVTDLELSTVDIQGTPTSMVVTFQEALSVVDQAGLAQRTQVGRTHWQLGRRIETSGKVTMLITAVAQEGPQFEVVIRGRVVAGLPTRVEVREKTGTLPIVGGEVEVPETGEVRELRPAGNHWHGIITSPSGPSPEALRLRQPSSCGRPGPSDDPGPSPKALRVRLRGPQGETIELQHRYHLQGPGEGVVQPVAGTGTTRFFAVAVTPDGTIWGGGDGGGTLVRVTPGATEVALVGQLLTEPDGRVEDLVVDALGRLHALVFAPHESRDIVFDPGIEHNPCPTVDVSHPAYPLLDGALRPSASVRAVAAGGGDLWLFGSDGGVARVADTFRGGVCPPGGAEVRYDPIFRRGESGLLSNSVPAFRVGADGALWFGTAVGLTRLLGQQFTPVLFDPELSVQGDVATLEEFFQEVAKAIFEARPLTSGALGDVSFRQRFGRDLVKPDLIFSLAEDGQRRMWVGTLGGGLRRVEARSGVLQDTDLLTRLQGLASNLILALAVGPDGTVWVATEQGVSRIREVGGTLTIASFTALDGLGVPVRDVAVAEDGTVWLGTDGGLFRIVAQGGVVRGGVIDSRGQPVAGAEVVVVGTPFRTVTDAAGHFELVDLPLGPIRLEVDGRLAARGPFDSVVHDVVVSVGEQSTPPVMLPEPGPLVRVSGEGQVGRVGGRLPQPLVVAVRDSQGQPVPGILVTFRVLEGTGVVSPATVVTGTDGQASTILTLGAVAGPNMVQAQVEGLGAVMFTASGIADRNTARLIIISGNRQVGVPGEVLPEPLVVQLEDQFGNPVVREPVGAVIIQGEGTLQPAMSPLGTSGGALPLQSIDEQTHTDAQGRAAFRLQLGFSGESVVVEVRAASLPQVSPVRFLTVIGLISPRGIAVEASNSLVVVDSDLRAVVRVDPVKRSAAIVGDSTTGHGPLLLEPLAIAVEATGALVVIDAGLGAVLRVDPQTGDRTIVSGCPEIDAEGRCVGEPIGQGPAFVFPRAIAVEATGALVVVDAGLGAVVRVDDHTGERTIVSGCKEINAEGRCVGGLIGGGFPFVLPEAMAVEAARALVVVDRGLGAVVRVDDHTGERTIVSGCKEINAEGRCVGGLIGGGPPFDLPAALAVEATGDLVVVDAGLGAVVRLAPHTGKRTIVSGCKEINAEGRCVGGLIGGGPPFDLPAALAVEATGDLVVVDAGLGAVVRLAPHTGERTIVRLGAGRGRGPRLDLPTDLAVEAAGSLVVIDAGLDAVVRVDPQTGDRALVSGCAAIDAEGHCVGGIIGGGPEFELPAALAVEATGALVVVDPRRGTDRGVDPHIGAVVRVDPHTGERTIVSGCAAIDAEGRCVGGIIGGGPEFELPAALAVEDTGALVVVDVELRAVMRVDSHTGERTIVSGCPAIDAQRNCLEVPIGQGPAFIIPSAIAVAADGHLIVVDSLRQAVIRVDPHTGERTIVSGCPPIDAEGRCVGGLIGSGPPFDFPGALAVEAVGSLVIVDPKLDAVVRVDPGTGNREIVSDARIGRGLPLVSPGAIAVEASGSLVVIDRKIKAVVRVDPQTGERTIVSVGAE